MRTALITGVTGQDGSYLAELLLSKGYAVHGIVRRSSNFNTQRVDHLYRDVHESGATFRIHFGDLLDAGSLRRILETVQPQEVYHLGAQSHVRVSFDLPVYTADIVALGTHRMLEAIRDFVVESASGDLTWPFSYEPAYSPESNRLLTAVRLANRRIYEQGCAHAAMEGMGTTVVAILAAGDQVALVSVMGVASLLLEHVSISDLRGEGPPVLAPAPETEG